MSGSHNKYKQRHVNLTSTYIVDFDDGQQPSVNITSAEMCILDYAVLL